MKVALITGFFDENFYYREHAYADYFKSIDLKYLIIASRFSLPQKKVKRIPIDTGKYFISRIPSIFKIKDFVILNYIKELEKFAPDIIHIFDGQQGVAIPAVIWAKKRKIPVVYDHELQRIPSSSFGKLRYYFFTRPIIKFLVLNSDLTRIVTPAALDLLKSISEFDYSKISLGHLGYSDNFSVDSNLPFVFESKIQYLMTSGFFDKSKKIESVVAGFLFFWRKNKNANLLIIGPIESPKVLSVINKFNSILHHDQLLNLSQLNYLYSKIRIHIWPKSTASIFEALKFDNYIILNKSDDTSHLNSKQIKFVNGFNMFTISLKFQELMDLPLERDNLQFSYSHILSKLLISYKKLVINRGT